MCESNGGTCTVCGGDLHGARTMYCSTKCLNSRHNAARSTGASTGWHRITEVDERAALGTCSICGPGTQVISGGRARARADGTRIWRCGPQFRLAAEWSSREAGWRKRGIFGFKRLDYEVMLARQNGRCAICLRESNATLVVDHCHTDGHVRGLLCSPCNTGLGQFGDDPARVSAALAYLVDRTAA